MWCTYVYKNVFCNIILLIFIIFFLSYNVVNIQQPFIPQIELVKGWDKG
jgi:hypothetical protein